MRFRPLIFALWCAAAAVTAAAEQPFFFVQLTDPQFGMYAKDADFAQETANFEFAVATVNRLRPAFVIVTGDLVNRTGDRAQIGEYLRIAGRIDRGIPLYHVAGNHDVGNEPTPETLAAYRKAFGPDRYTFKSGSMAGIVVNSALMHAPAAARAELEEQQRWLADELRKARLSGARPIVVFQHHPLFVRDPDEPDSYGNIPAALRGRLIELYLQSGVAHVFGGHAHKDRIASTQGLQMTIAGPIGMPLDRGRSGMGIAVVRDTGIEYRYADLGDIPNRIDLGR